MLSSGRISNNHSVSTPPVKNKLRPVSFMNRTGSETPAVNEQVHVIPVPPSAQLNNPRPSSGRKFMQRPSDPSSPSLKKLQAPTKEQLPPIHSGHIFKAPEIPGVVRNDVSAKDVCTDGARDIFSWLEPLYTVEKGIAIKPKPLDPWTSLARVQRLQKALLRTDYDCLLFIAGIDGEYNEYGRHILKFLLGFDTQLEFKDIDEQEAMQDITLVLKRSEIHLCTNHKVLERFGKYIYRWPNIRLYGLDSDQTENEDFVEEYKIKSFIRMMKGMKTVGLAYTSPEEYEYWSLIKAYAIEEFGEKFFTQAYQVENASLVVYSVMADIDSHALLELVCGQFSLFAKNWDMTLELLDGNIHDSEKLTEPLRIFFNYGRKGSSSKARFQPNVTVTENDSLKIIAIEGSDSKEQVLSGRTYFVRKAKLVDEEEHLIRLYEIMRVQCSLFIRLFCEGSQDQLSKNLLKVLDEARLSISNVEVNVWELDENHQRHIKAQPGTFRMKYIRMNVDGILYGETFIENYASKGCERTWLNLTRSIQDIGIWDMTNDYQEIADLESVSIVIGETRMKAMCSFSETHITIISRRMQRMSINLKTDVESVLYCQPQDQFETGLIQFRLNCCNQKSVTIILPQKSKTQRSVFDGWLPKWRMLLELNMMEYADRIRFTNNLLISDGTFFHLRRIFDFAYINQWSPQDFETMLNDKKGCHPQNQIQITILTGITGSGRHKLCASIKDFCSELINWRILEQPCSNIYNPLWLQQQMTSIYASNSFQTPALGDKKTKLILITPGYSDVRQTISAIESHPNLIVRDAFRIGCVTCCVHISNVFTYGMELYPRILSNCAYGFVQNIVIFGSSKESTKQYSLICAMIKSVNPDINVFHASTNDFIYQDEALESITSGELYYDLLEHKRRILLQTYQKNSSSDFGYSSFSLRCTIALDRSLFEKQLGSFVQNFHRMKAKVLIADSPLAYIDVVARDGKYIVNDLSIHPSTSNKDVQELPLSEFVIHGYQLKQDDIKEALRRCVKTYNLLPQQTKRWHELSQTDVENILEEHLNDPLPDNWYFNGVKYIHVDGESNDKRPDWKAIVERHILKARDQIREAKETFSKMFI